MRRERALTQPQEHPLVEAPRRIETALERVLATTTRRAETGVGFDPGVSSVIVIFTSVSTKPSAPSAVALP